MDWVPRSVRARARDIERAIADLERKLLRAPSDEEIAGEVRPDRPRARRQPERDRPLVDRGSRGFGRSPRRGGDQVALIDTLEDETGPSPHEALEPDRAQGGPRRAIARLPEREKLVDALLLRGAHPPRDGEVLGVTESRVSQLHTKAILRWRRADIPAGSRLDADAVQVTTLPLDGDAAHDCDLSSALRGVEKRKWESETPQAADHRGSGGCPRAHRLPQRRRRR